DNSRSSAGRASRRTDASCELTTLPARPCESSPGPFCRETRIERTLSIQILSDGGSGAYWRNGRFRRSHFHAGSAWKHDGGKIRLHRLRIPSRIRSAGIGEERYDEC